ncbi:MAG: hypothetical protein IKZ47_01195 [Clostridia bacterium]|nr:hypothetical protein [Clostridia bacterium]
MQTDPTAIFEEYNKAKKYKESLGEKGLYEQTKINTRFYSGNQWYGANCGNERPLVRHNVIKRIGDFKMSQTAAKKNKITFFAAGAEQNRQKSGEKKPRREGLDFKGEVTPEEIGALCEALGGYYRFTAESMGLEALAAKVLRQAYLSGTGVLYTYFDGDADTGLTLYGNKIKGDIACEVLSVCDVYFADGEQTDTESQPYIILASEKGKEAVLREAQAFGSALTEENIKADEDGKVTVLTKLFKVYSKDGVSVHCVKVTENGVLREEYDTRLHRYPLAVFRFDEDDGCAYGESEVTYLIPNQIAINRMITASVWSNISLGMPMMVVNGDTVSGDISNDPGQIIRIYGTNEDVAGAIRYVAPPGAAQTLSDSVESLINNTLTQSGANPSALGDERAQNAAAIERLQNAATMPLNVLKWRYREFLRQNAGIWLDFWMNLYGSRGIRTEDENGVWYFPLDPKRYKDISICAAVNEESGEKFEAAEKISVLSNLFDKGVITARQYLSRLPEALLPEKGALISGLKENENEA